jgi:hypothetical protein
MLPFASLTTTTLEVPFDPPHTVTIRRLSGRHLAKAREASQTASIENLKRLGGAAFQRELSALGSDEDRARQLADFAADPLNAYDRYELMKRGIVAWSYEQPVSDEAIEDLSEEAVEYFAREILRLSKPRLFQTAEEAEVARGEGSGGSIVP